MIIPLVIFYFLVFTDLLWFSYKNNKPKNGKYDFWVTLIANSLILVLIWWLIGWKFW